MAEITCCHHILQLVSYILLFESYLFRRFGRIVSDYLTSLTQLFQFAGRLFNLEISGSFGLPELVHCWLNTLTHWSNIDLPYMLHILLISFRNEYRSVRLTYLRSCALICPFFLEGCCRDRENFRIMSSL